MQTKIYLCYSDPDTACGGRAFRPFKQERHGGVSDVGKTAAVAPGSGVSHCMEHFVHINGNQFSHDLVFRKSGKTAGS